MAFWKVEEFSIFNFIEFGRKFTTSRILPGLLDGELFLYPIAQASNNDGPSPNVHGLKSSAA